MPALWEVKLPDGLTLIEIITYGTVGSTGVLSVYRLLDCCVMPDLGKLLVSGASVVVSISVSTGSLPAKLKVV